jgi:serine/threonine protein kinase
LLKPSNLMVGAGNQIHILDFGIGCLLAETEGESLVDTMSTANSVASGLDCASPESIMDPTNLTPSGDQYSLGCILYFCLTGQYPFPDGSSAEKMMAHQFKEPTPIKELNPEVPADLVEVVQRLMHKSPEKRFASAAEVVEALRPLADAPLTSVRPMPRPVAAGRPAPGPRAVPAPENRAPVITASTPTPKPKENASLPSRKSVRGAATPPAATPPVPRKPPESYLEDHPGRDWMDETISPAAVVGVLAVVVVIAIALFTWVL